MNNEIFCDATPQFVPEIPYVPKISSKDLSKILNGLSADHYVSMFFLLTEHLKRYDFLSISKEKLPVLREKFCELYDDVLNEEILVELFGTMKLYKNMKMLNTCAHVYKLNGDKYNRIDKLWKLLYSLCEEIPDEDLVKLKTRVQNLNTVQNLNIDQISCAEHLFYYALQNEFISRYDLSKLKVVLSDFPTCLKLLKQYEGELKNESYYIKTPTSLTPCGIAVIFNFERFHNASGLTERMGSNHDADILKKLWTAYGFETKVLCNLSKSETLQEMQRISMEDHSKYEAFVCCILSHGESNAVYTSDGEKVPILEIIAPVANKCRTLISKPKLFIIQACQGRMRHPDLQDNNTANGNPNFITPQFLDLFIVTSTLPGYVSYRSKTKGTWFIQTLSDVMFKVRDKCSIQNVVYKVTNEMKEKKAPLMNGINAKQICSAITTLTKDLILKRML